jgi:uncharacterized protein involved in exopolysaccharide biosynthesis
METRTLYDHWLVIRRSAWLVVLTTASAVASAYFLSLSMPKLYESTEEFSIVPESQQAFFAPGAGTLRAQLAPLLLQEMQKWYQATLESHAIRERVAAAVTGVTAGELYDAVDVEVTRKHVLRVRVRDRDPQRAAAIASVYPAALNDFMRASSERRQEQSMRTATETLRVTEEQLRDARRRLADFHMAGRTAGLNREVERLAERKTALEADISRGQGRIDALERRIAMTGEQLATESRNLKGAGGALLGGPVQRLLLEVSDLEAELAAVRVEFDGKLGERHPRVRTVAARLEQKRRDLDAQIAALDASGARPADSLVEQLRREFLNLHREHAAARAEDAATRATLELLMRRIDALQSARQSEEQMLADIARFERMRDTLALRIRETQVQALAPSDLVVRLTPAVVPREHKFPLPWLNAAIGAVLGFFAGVYLAFFADWLGRSRAARGLR